MEPKRSGWIPWALGLFCLLLTALSARPYAGGWNDGSRLAAVESLVDRQTLTIDESVFCHPSAESIAADRAPYPSNNPDLLKNGTSDKLFINGHYYSDKPAVISLLMAGIYQTALLLGLPSAAERPDLFCYEITWGSAGLAYLVAVLSIYQIGLFLRLPGKILAAWVGSFALATFALAYTRHTNNHILQLGSLALICLQMLHISRNAASSQISRGRLVLLGSLAGLSFNLDLGAGPLLVAALFFYSAYTFRTWKPVAVYTLAALPWVIAGLGINYSIGGVIKPINMVPEYSSWPGCPFTPENMTGFSRHSPIKLTVYALALLFGKHGFLVHNIPLLLSLPAAFFVLRKSSPLRPVLLTSLGWCAATWLLYSALSNNYGGGSCSIRWFAPFLAPGYLLLGIYLKDYPRYFADFLTLSFWGTLFGAIMWTVGPWSLKMIPLLWPTVGCALVSWGICRYRLSRTEEREELIPQDSLPVSRAA
jgi:hypothetical protein